MSELTKPPLNVLFLCTHNSARSILAEALLNDMGKGRFKAYSAGSHPNQDQQPNPYALTVLENAGVSIDGLSSKSWDVFGGEDAPAMDLIITVCDDTVGEVCPIWPGHPATAHWGYSDPSTMEGSEDEKLEAFKQSMLLIRRRLELLISLPMEKLEQSKLESSARDLAN
ncbi:MAG: arsenate reductase ArsC [Alcaligenaceae bacterium]|nr:arsenate reductase ArsC [Alcaligenaceae bacterium]